MLAATYRYWNIVVLTHLAAVVVQLGMMPLGMSLSANNGASKVKATG